MAAVQKRILIDLADFVMLRIRCAECGHDHLHQPSEPMDLPAFCARCKAQLWPNGARTCPYPERDLLDHLRRVLTMDDTKRTVRLVWEIDADLLKPTA